MAGAIPPEVRATWPKPNYSNPESRRGALLGVEIVLLFITVLVMALRMYTRKVIRKSVGLDDWLMTLATVTLALSSSMAFDVRWTVD